MIILSSELTDEAAANVAVCILGSGAAGITLACELAGTGRKVLVLEAGLRKPQASTQDYYAGAANPPHPAASEYRRVTFGGTTGVWGGRCVPFDPIDFEPRDHIPNSGWPISHAEVAQYYPRALEYCDAGQFDFTATGSIEGARPTISDLRPNPVLQADLIERYSLPTDFGARYADLLRASENVTVVLGARCIALLKGQGADRIDAVDIALPTGARRTIRAGIIVLAMGGIESARLLLASDPGGIGYGNRTDRLGRFYACHLESTIGKLLPNGAAVMFDFERTRDGAYCRRKLQFTAAALREHRLLNTAFRLHFPEYSDASHGSSVMSTIYLAKSVLIPEYRDILQHNTVSAVNSPAAEHWRNVVRGLPELSKFAADWLFKRQLARRKLPYTLVANADGTFPVEFNCEQTPLESSRITLADEIDAHGMRRVRIDWRRSDADILAARRAYELLATTLSETSACRLQINEEQLFERLSRAPPVGGHHIGTARMAASSRDGVVDGNCALFDFPNVYVASSAVFPTGSHANPTLTIVALAIRMAAHIQSQFALM